MGNADIASPQRSIAVLHPCLVADSALVNMLQVTLREVVGTSVYGSSGCGTPPSSDAKDAQRELRKDGDHTFVVQHMPVYGGGTVPKEYLPTQVSRQAGMMPS